jgi:SagB-type dehydrogenase family enzyme
LKHPVREAEAVVPVHPADANGDSAAANGGSADANGDSAAATRSVRAGELRPLVAGSIRWTDDALDIDIGDREVRIEGDLVLARSVIGSCDGRRTVRTLFEQHGPDGADLIEQLLSCGALVDCTESWRVFHRHGSVGTALGRPLDTADLLRLQRLTFRPSGLASESVPLQPLDSATQGLTSRRRSAFPLANGITTSFSHLSSVLASAYRFEHHPRAPSASGGSVASAGALYPLILHVLIRNAPPELAAGLWWYDPQSLQLDLVRQGEREIAGLFVSDPLTDALLASGEPVLFISADLERPARKYGARGYRYALMEAGAVMQTAAMTAAELGLPLRPIGGFHDAHAHAFLELPATGVCLLALSLGC